MWIGDMYETVLVISKEPTLTSISSCKVIGKVVIEYRSEYSKQQVERVEGRVGGCGFPIGEEFVVILPSVLASV